MLLAMNTKVCYHVLYRREEKTHNIQECKERRGSMGSVFDCRLATDQAARLAGASVRQLDYWCNRGLITPTTPAQGKGSAREFGFVDIVRIKVLVNLRQAGVPLQRIRKALKQLKEWNEKDPLTSGRLLAVGDQLFWVESDEVLLNILKQQRAMAPVVLVDVAELAHTTRLEMAEMCAA